MTTTWHSHDKRALPTGLPAFIPGNAAMPGKLNFLVDSTICSPRPLHLYATGYVLSGFFRIDAITPITRRAAKSLCRTGWSSAGGDSSGNASVSGATKKECSSELAAQLGMADSVREQEPCRAWLEVPKTARRALLKFLVCLQKMMQAQHELVVFGPLQHVRMKEPEQFLA